jgi:predicted transcriptional regulator
MDKMVRITICIEPETERLLRLLARRYSRSISELVREAIGAHWVRLETANQQDNTVND